MNDSCGGTPPASGFLQDPRWQPAIRDALAEMVVEHAGAIAAFDFDNTILDGDLSETLLTDMDRNSPEALFDAYLAECEADTHTGYANLVETLIADKTEMEVRAYTREVLDRSLNDGTLRIRPAFVELIWAMQRHGWEVWIVTASPAVVIGVPAQRIGIPANRVLGMWCAPDAEGRFTRPTREPVTYRQGKVDALFGATNGTAPTFAAGDALTDLEMLVSARYALVLDRGDPVLRAEASKRSWWLQGGL